MRSWLYTPSPFLNSASAPPHPPSFPTRRSSDLKRHSPSVDTQNRVRCSCGRYTISTSAPLSRTSDTGALEKMVYRPQEDRKSTRLNSSHLGISYAVFCLKKKKKDSQNHTLT